MQTLLVFRDACFAALGEAGTIVALGIFFVALGVLTRWLRRVPYDSDMALRDFIMGNSLVLHLALLIALFDVGSLSKLLSSGVAVAELASVTVYSLVRHTMTFYRQLVS
ncbi:MAG: hypothetical protein R3D02_13655 [Hyphomicrobiales bacterium]